MADDTTTEDRLLQEIHEELVGALPPTSEWDSASIEWSSVGGDEYASRIRVLGYGQSFERPLPASVPPRLRELKALGASPSRGAPIGYAVYVSSEGTTAGADANFDSRVVLDATGAPAYQRQLAEADVRPTRESWRRELERFPRADEYVPDWWRALAGGESADVTPSLPSWFGGPMPQTLDEAEAQTRNLVPKFEPLVKFAGYAAIIDDLVASIHATARRAPADELDAIFGRRGRAAQAAAQQQLAVASVTAIEPRLTERTGGEADEMIRAWHGHARDGGPDEGASAAQQLRSAVNGFAGRIVARRFGTLPKNWHVA